MFYILLPIYAFFRIILHQYSATILQEHHENTFGEELAEIMATFTSLFRTVKAAVGKKKQ